MSLCLRVISFKWSKIHILAWSKLKSALSGIIDSKLVSFGFGDRKSQRHGIFRMTFHRLLVLTLLHPSRTQTPVLTTPDPFSGLAAILVGNECLPKRAVGDSARSITNCGAFFGDYLWSRSCPPGFAGTWCLRRCGETAARE